MGKSLLYRLIHLLQELKDNSSVWIKRCFSHRPNFPFSLSFSPILPSKSFKATSDVGQRRIVIVVFFLLHQSCLYKVFNSPPTTAFSPNTHRYLQRRITQPVMTCNQKHFAVRQPFSLLLLFQRPSGFFRKLPVNYLFKNPCLCRSYVPDGDAKLKKKNTKVASSGPRFNFLISFFYFYFRITSPCVSLSVTRLVIAADVCCIFLPEEQPGSFTPSFLSSF